MTQMNKTKREIQKEHTQIKAAYRTKDTFDPLSIEYL